MINYELFKDYERIYDKDNPYVGIFKLEDNIFIIEPNFYTQLLGMKEHHYDKFNLIMNKLIGEIKKNKKVIFTADYEAPVCYKDDFVYREIEDITNPLHIFVEDKSRGSDYGD